MTTSLIVNNIIIINNNIKSVIIMELMAMRLRRIFVKSMARLAK